MKPEAFTLHPEDPHAASALRAYASSMVRHRERDEDARAMRELANAFERYPTQQAASEAILQQRAEELEASTFEELYALAAELLVGGRSTMNKAELVAAIMEYEADAAE